MSFGLSSANLVQSPRCDDDGAQIKVHRRIDDGHLSSRQLGRLKLFRMRCGSMTISRPLRSAAPGTERTSTFILQVAGEGSFSHYGHRITLSPGDFTLRDDSAPYTLHFDRPAEAVMLRVPTTLVKEVLPTPDCFCGRRLESGVSITSTAAAMAIDLSEKAEETLDSQSRERVARHLLDVLASAYAAGLDQSVDASSVMARRLWMVKLYIEQNLRDPTLSPSCIADQLKLSNRYLRTIFAASDETPSAYILRRRLEECAQQLADPLWRGHSITEIAFSWGFNSAPHFARTFRERFDMSPRDYRQRHAEGGERPAAARQRRARGGDMVAQAA